MIHLAHVFWGRNWYRYLMISTEHQLETAVIALSQIASMGATPGISVSAAAETARKALQRLAWAEEMNAQAPAHVRT